MDMGLNLITRYVLKHTWGLWLLGIAALGLLAGVCRADDFTWEVKAGIAGEYGDNLYSEADDKASDGSMVLSSQARVSNDTERLKFQLAGELSGTVYGRYDDLNNLDWRVKNNVTWLAGERTSLSSNINVGEDSSIDRYLSETGTLLDTRKNRTLRWSGSVSHFLGERLTGFLGVDLADENLETGDDNGRDYSMNSYGLSSGLRFQADEQTRLSAVLGYGYYDYETSDVDQISAVAGVERSLSERLSCGLTAGALYTAYTYEVLEWRDNLNWTEPPLIVTVEKTDRSWGFTGGANLSYRDDERTFRISVEEKSQPSTSEGRSLEVTSVNLGYQGKIDENLGYRVSGSYRFNRSDDPDLDSPLRTRTWQVSPALDYTIGDNLLIQGVYTFTEYREKPENIQRNVFRVMCEYTLK